MKYPGWQTVCELMREGWQLYRDYDRWWLQKGSESKQVHSATGSKLLRDSLVKAASPKDSTWRRTVYMLIK